MAVDLSTAAARVKAASTLPTGERGSILPYVHASQFAPGWNVYAAQSQLDLPDDLKYPKSRQTYNAMERVPQIGGLLTAVYLPIRNMQFYVDPAGTTGTVAEEIAEDFGLPLEGDEQHDEDGPGVDYDEHLRLALLAIAHGHKAFELSGIIEGTGPGAKFRLRRLFERPNETLQDIFITAGGDLVSVRVPSAEPLVDGPFYDIPADHLMYYCWDRRGGDWTGRPLLYTCYQSWLLRDEQIREDAVLTRRFGGLYVVNVTQPGISQATINEAAAMAMQAQSGDGAGVTMPYGTELVALGIQGTLPQPLNSVKYHDSQLARVFMQGVLELPNKDHGSRALADPLMDHYALSIGTIAYALVKTQMQVVRRIVEWNYGPGTALPHIRFREDEVKELATDALVSLIDSGAITVDDDLEAQIRQRGNLVPRNPAQKGRTAAVDVTAEPKNAPAARRQERSHRHDHHPTAAISDVLAVGADALQAAFEAALSLLKATWNGIRAAQIEDLVSQVKAAESMEDVAAVAPQPLGGQAFAQVLAPVIADGAASVVAEAMDQGVDLAIPNLDEATTLVAAAAGAVAILLATSLGQSAASKALSMWGADPDREAVAEAVGKHLNELAGQTADYELAGLATQAQNEGRFVALEGADNVTFYAYEPGVLGIDGEGGALTDGRICGECVKVNGTEYASMGDARLDYPAGYYRDCEGGKRCRGTVRARFKAPGTGT